MLYTTITINKKEYKCRLNARALVECERRLGKNPINVLMAMGENNIPSLETLLTMFHCSLLPYNHSITMDMVFDMYDEYCDNGGSFVSFVEEVITPIIMGSGLVPSENEVVDKETAKNAE